MDRTDEVHPTDPTDRRNQRNLTNITDSAHPTDLTNPTINSPTDPTSPLTTKKTSKCSGKQNVRLYTARYKGSKAKCPPGPQEARTLRYGTVPWYITTRWSITIAYDMILYVRYYTVSYNTVQHCTVWYGRMMKAWNRPQPSLCPPLPRPWRKYASTHSEKLHVVQRSWQPRTDTRQRPHAV